MDTSISLPQVERWDVFDRALRGPADGNPFADVRLKAVFRHGHRTVETTGFYDGDGVYRIRCMPDETGDWTYETSSNEPALDGIAGRFRCTEAQAGNRGPVRVKDEFHFAYEDGTPYIPIGTTCYAWTHQTAELQEETLRTLAAAPFNKLRMCVMPKNYSFNNEEPERFPFPGSRETGFDFTRLDPAFFAHLERRIRDLQRLGIEADLILFHPYDKGRWGFDEMPAAVDDFYLRYLIARLAPFRNVWWALANECDFAEHKSTADWDRLFRIVQTEDAYAHPRSIHNGTTMYDDASVVMYDHGKSWVTHCSIQHWDVSQTQEWQRTYRKPVVIDECGYEGNLPQRWGNLTAEEMTRRFWDGVARGGYVTHGETYVHPDDEIWWAKGVRLYGDSPRRIDFLRRVLDEAPADCRPLPVRDVPTIGVAGRYYLQYFGLHRPAYRMLELPEDGAFAVELIDTWEMTVTKQEGAYAGTCRVDLPGKPYIAVRITRIAE